MTRILSTVLLGLLVLAGATAAVAAAQDGDVLGCVGEGSGFLRIVQGHDECRSQEEPIALEAAGGDQQASGGLLSVITFLSPGLSYATCSDGEWSAYRCAPTDVDDDARAWRLDTTSLRQASSVEFVVRVRTAWSEFVCVRLYDLTADAVVPGTELCHTDERPVPEDTENHDGPRNVMTRLTGQVDALPAATHEFIVQTRGRACEATTDPQQPCGHQSGTLETAELVVTP